MKIHIEIDEKDLKEMVRKKIQELAGDVEVKEEHISILVKSKQNYKSEWESAAFKAEYNHASYG